MLIALSIALLTAANIMFFSRRLLRYLYHFQEQEYNRKYFTGWMIENGIYDKKGTMIATIAAIAIEFNEKYSLTCIVICLIGSFWLISLGFWEKDPRKVGSSRLEENEQSAAIYNRSLALHSIAFTIAIALIHRFNPEQDMALYWLAIIVSIQSSPIWLFIAKKISKHKFN
jgi:hypothetical protein